MNNQNSADQIIKNIKTTHVVRVGNIDVEVPLRYKCRAINLVFPISYNEAQKVIKYEKVKPYKFLPGLSLLVITFFDFSWSQVGPFTEMTFSIPVEHNRKFDPPFFSLLIDKIFNKLNFYVVLICQSTKIAIDHGNKITGYPHYSNLVDVTFHEYGDYTSVISSGDGKKILEFKIKKVDKQRVRSEFYATYRSQKDEIAKAMMETHGVVGASKILDFKLGDHELSDFLRKLKIIPKAVNVRNYRDTVKIIHHPKIL